MKNWKQININQLNSDKELLEEFYRDYSKVLGKPCLSCKNKLNSYLIELINYKPNKIMEKTCKLKAGHNPYNPIDHVVMTDANMDDETALKLLEQNPNRASWFDVLPVGYEDPRKAKKVAKKAPETPSYRDELIALPKIGPSTADKIIEAYPSKEALKEGLEKNEVDAKANIIEILTTYVG